MSVRDDDKSRESRPLHGFWKGVAGGAGVTALAAALAIFAVLPPSASTLISSVIDAHGQALTHGQTIMVASGDRRTIKPWLASHIGISPPVGDFAGAGFALTGGRTDEVAGSRAAVIVYAHGDHEIDVFAWPDRGAHLPAPGLTHGFRRAFWKSGDLDFAAVSDVDAAEFEKFVFLAQAAAS